MNAAKKTAIEIINNMHDDKVLKVLSFVKFIENEEDEELYISEDEENELIYILENDENVDGNTVLDKSLGAEK